MVVSFQLKLLETDCGCLCICEKFNRHFSNLSYQRYIIQLIKKKKITITFAKIFFKFLKITFLTNTLLLFTIKTNNTFPFPTNFKFSHQFRINPYSISKDLTAPEKISLEKKGGSKIYHQILPIYLDPLRISSLAHFHRLLLAV